MYGFISRVFGNNHMPQRPLPLVSWVLPRHKRADRFTQTSDKDVLVSTFAETGQLRTTLGYIGLTLLVCSNVTGLL